MVTFIKKYIGCLIISFGILLLIGSVLMAAGIKLPEGVAGYMLEAWLVLALLIYPFARKFIRV